MFGEAEEESEWQEGGKEEKERAGSDRDGVEAPTSPARDVADSKQEAFLEPSSPKPGKEESHCQHEQGQPADVLGCTCNHSSVHSARQPNHLLPVDVPPASLPHHVTSLPSETQAADAEKQEASSSPVGPDLAPSAYPSDSPSSMLPAPSRLANMRQRHISFTAAEAPYLSREASEGEGREGRSKGGRKGGRKERQLMDAWSWIGKCDELSRAMETGDLLFGFHEAPIRFPPSFRWVSGASAGDFTQLSLLEKCFTLKAFSKKSGWTPRPPSYTGSTNGGKKLRDLAGDRILFHALPDVVPRVFIQGYDMCDAITGSDHRPVVCRVDLKLNTDIIGFNTVPQVSSHIPSLSHRSSSSSSLPSVPLSPSSASHEISPGRVKPSRALSRLRHETTGDEEVERRKPRSHDSKPVPPQHQGPQGLPPRSALAWQGRDPPAPGREVGTEGGQDAAAIEAAEPVGGGEGGGHERGKRRDRACETSLLPRREEAIPANGPARPAPLDTSSTSYSSSFLSTVASHFQSAYLKRARPPSSSPRYHAVLAGPRASPLLQASNSHLRPVFKPYTGPLAIWTVELTHLLLVGDSDDNDIDVPEYDEMTVRREERKEGEGKPSIGRANLFSSSLPPPHILTPASSAGGESSPIRQKDGDSQEETITHLVHSVHRISHRSLQHAHEQSPTSQGLSMTVHAIVAPAFTRHLLIKLTDYKGRDIGQGVISLPPALPSSLLSSSSSAPGVHLYVPLSLGAQPQTVLLSLRCRVTEKPFHAPTREGGLGGMGKRRGEERGGEAQA
ncbi:hypothetical protein NSK_003392 [Nannochloropsis salina CCMP1776]|nr:hypothetical protein NSK_003392 [Nannochloropsis salina CCMP1776]|eukprot:TFJ85346.1 hypothetical protein NSK_003392 [Nannochloropsis salina CCMP1776]